ncbi:hypothetical protein Tco_0558138 [Tanacetum coccineum]
MHQEKVQQEKLKAVKARFNFEEASQHSKSGTLSRRRDHKKGLDLDLSAACPEAPNQDVAILSPQGKEIQKEKRCSKGWRRVETDFASDKYLNKRASSQRTEALSESEGSAGGHWKSKPKRQKSSIEDDLSQPWVCEEIDPFTPRIHYFNFLKTRMPSHIKTYDRSEDLKDHLKIFQAAAKTGC